MYDLQMYQPNTYNPYNPSNIDGSSSQQNTNLPMSLIHPFSVDDLPMYEHQFTESMPNTVRENSPVEKVLAKKKKALRRRQKGRFEMTTKPGAFREPQKKKLHCAKVRFVYTEIASLGQSEEESNDIIDIDTSGNGEALARLMMSEYEIQTESFFYKKKQDYTALLEIRN
ncbi:hypothetical protein Tco_0900518 [Tanacetum coccineum]